MKDIVLFFTGLFFLLYIVIGVATYATEVSYKERQPFYPSNDVHKSSFYAAVTWPIWMPGCVFDKKKCP